MTQAVDPRAVELARVFAGAGEALYLVGGSVRDLLLGRPSRDLDFATSARPAVSRALLDAFGPLWTVGEKFGTVGVPGIEVTTFRTEIYAAGSRKPQVAAADLIADLGRRDFTINAMALNPLTGEIIDPYGGRIDLVGRVIRSVGVPVLRFGEDPLRLLRAARLAAQLDCTVERVTMDAMRQEQQALRTVSPERRRDEMTTLLLTDRPREGLQVLYETELLPAVDPSLEMLYDTRDQGPHHCYTLWGHTCLVVEGVVAEPRARWAALFHDTGKADTRQEDETGRVTFPEHEVHGATLAAQATDRLRFGGRDQRDISALVANHMRVNHYQPTWGQGAVNRLVAAYPDPGVVDLAMSLAYADRRAHRVTDTGRLDHLAARLREQPARPETFASPLDGHELMAHYGRESGPWLRSVKAYLRDLVIDGQIHTKEHAYDALKTFTPDE